MKTTERPARQNLVKKYRPIGPAAIAAAVHAMKKRKPKTANGEGAVVDKIEVLREVEDNNLECISDWFAAVPMG